MVRLFFDILHGIDRADIPLVIALEFAILLGHDGQLGENSKMEMELFENTIDQLKRTKMSKTENALMWLYAKTWKSQGQHIIDRDELWNFGGEDLQEIILAIAYPFKKETKSKDEDKSQKDLAESLR